MPPTLARRYFFKLAANMVTIPVYLVMEAILPRALGPSTYGNFSFATGVFQQLCGFLDMGTSTCFYNLLSRRQSETSLFAFYLRISLFTGIALLFCGAICSLTPAGRWLMPDVPSRMAPLAALWALLTWYSRILRSTNDALGATIPSELWRSALSIAALVLLIGLYFSDRLDILTLFLQQYAYLISLCLACWLVTRKDWQKSGLSIEYSLSPSQKLAYKKEFFNYTHPLFVQALLSFFMLTAERWLLQWFDGSNQQGFFALSQKVSMACFLFVSAMTPLLMREFSVAWGKGDTIAIGAILSRFAPSLYALAAYFSCFTVAEARSLVEIFGGAQFVAATLPVQIMALYPLHQSYGQMAGSVFHASGKTHILRNMTALECIYGLAAAWVLLAPRQLWGLNLGAAGLAIKTVSVQFLSVNLYLWLASRFIPFAFWKNLLSQVLCVIVLLALAFLGKTISLESGIFADSTIWRFITSGIIYTILVIALFLLNPKLLGISKESAAAMLGNLKRFGSR